MLLGWAASPCDRPLKLWLTGGILLLSALPKRRDAAAPSEWMAAVDTMVDGLRRFILVKESGEEKIQFFQ